MRSNPRRVRVPGLLDDGRAMVAQRFGVDMHRRRAQGLTRFQWIERRSHRPPGSTWDSGALVHRCALPVASMRVAESDRSHSTGLRDRGLGARRGMRDEGTPRGRVERDAPGPALTFDPEEGAHI